MPATSSNSAASPAQASRPWRALCGAAVRGRAVAYRQLLLHTRQERQPHQRTQAHHHRHRAADGNAVGAAAAHLPGGCRRCATQLTWRCCTSGRKLAPKPLAKAGGVSRRLMQQLGCKLLIVVINALDKCDHDSRSTAVLKLLRLCAMRN